VGEEKKSTCGASQEGRGKKGISPFDAKREPKKKRGGKKQIFSRGEGGKKEMDLSSSRQIRGIKT